MSVFQCSTVEPKHLFNCMVWSARGPARPPHRLGRPVDLTGFGEFGMSECLVAGRGQQLCIALVANLCFTVPSQLQLLGFCLQLSRIGPVVDSAYGCCMGAVLSIGLGISGDYYQLGVTRPMARSSRCKNSAQEKCSDEAAMFLLLVCCVVQHSQITHTILIDGCRRFF